MTKAVTLTDSDARDTIATDLSSTLFIEAGAGTGKTTAMVNRIANLVESGVPIGRVAAVTFTEAAARELRSRLRQELENRGAANNDKQLLDAAAGVEGTAITTVHGFALRLLSDHPVEAGLPPGFAVADEIASMLDFNEGWREFIERVGDDMDLLELQERASVLNIKLRSMFDMAGRFNENWDVLNIEGMKPEPLEPIRVSTLVEDIIGLADLGTHYVTLQDPWVTGLNELCLDAENQKTRDEIDQLRWLAGGPAWPSQPIGSKAIGSTTAEGLPDISDDVKAAIDDIRSRVEAELARCSTEVMNHPEENPCKIK